VAKRKRAHHLRRVLRWARRKRAFAHPTISTSAAKSPAVMDTIDGPYLPLVIRKPPLPLDPSFEEQNGSCSACKGVFYACKAAPKRGRFNRLLIEAGMWCTGCRIQVENRRVGKGALAPCPPQHATQMVGTLALCPPYDLLTAILRHSGAMRSIEPGISRFTMCNRTSEVWC